LMSPEGMAAMGMDQSQIDKAMADNKKLTEDLTSQFKVVPIATESGGGGGGASSRPYVGTEDSKPASGDGGMGTRSLAGMKKNIGGESIGVSVDNIFEMIKRRYKTMRDAKSFYQ
jgi:hypothetical protein